jgi:hypothetical protein
MANEFSDLGENHCLLRMIFPDLLVLLPQFFCHQRHLCVQVGIIRLGLFEILLHLVELFLVRPLRNLPKNVSGSTGSQRRAGPSGDELQPVVLGLKLIQLVVDSFEGIFRKIPGGEVHVLPG